MGQLPEVTVKAWRAITTPLHIFAIGCTVFRLRHRYRNRQLWWDDYWAGVSLIFAFVYMFGPWLRDEIDDPRSPKSKRILVYWWGTQLYPLVVWTARISIGMSIARLTPPKTRYRYLLYAMNGIFAAMCASQLLQKIIKCTSDTSWHNNRNVQCYIGSSIAILSFSMDLAADTCLVAIPIRMLWRVKLPRSQRRLILSIFASSLTSSMVGLIYAVFTLEFQKYRGNWGYRIGLISAIKAAVTLLVCNLLVIVTCLYRVFRRDEKTTTGPPTTENTPALPMPIMPTATFQPPETPTRRPYTTEISLTRLSESIVLVHSVPHPALPIKQLNRCLTV